MIDSYRHKALRRDMVFDLREKGIGDERVLAAMFDLPRHFFLEKAFEEWAYADRAFPIGNDQTISQPFTVAFQTALLNLERGEKVLEIGTGSGYQAAILAMLGAKVCTIERQETLHKSAKKMLSRLEYPQIQCFFGDGYAGLPQLAPFDRILVTAGAAQIPKILCQQLAIGGIMVIPVGDASQKMLRIRRFSETEFETEECGDFRFVPFLKGVNRK
ncbi:MAG: hypothetical protein RL757_1054 [Bacteroidota bacterium]